MNFVLEGSVPGTKSRISQPHHKTSNIYELISEIDLTDPNLITAWITYLYTLLYYMHSHLYASRLAIKLSISMPSHSIHRGGESYNPS